MSIVFFRLKLSLLCMERAVSIVNKMLFVHPFNKTHRSTHKALPFQPPSFSPQRDSTCDVRNHWKFPLASVKSWNDMKRSALHLNAALNVAVPFTFSETRSISSHSLQAISRVYIFFSISVKLKRKFSLFSNKNFV